MVPKQQGATGERQKSAKRLAPDHLYALPACPNAIKAKLKEALATVRRLQQEKSNALARERRAKKNMGALLEELRDKNLINEELKDKLDCYSGKVWTQHTEYVLFCYKETYEIPCANWFSDLPVHLLSRQGSEYTKAQREFALTLYLHGPKAYQYLRDTLHIHLPHPSSLQRCSS